MLIGGALGDHGFGHEPRGERERRDRQRADDAANGRQRHGAKQAAKVRALALGRHVEHRAGRHQQQRLVDDVGEGVRGRTVERHFRADAGARNHESDLIHDGVGEDAPHVVLQDRVHDSVEDHVETDVDQDLSAGETAQQGVDGRLGGEGRQEYHTRPGGLRVGIGQPRRKRRRPGIDEKAGEDQPARQRIGRHRSKGDGAGGSHLAGDAGHQQHAAEEVHRRIAKPGSRAAGPHNTMSVEAIAITSQQIKRVMRSPAKATPMALPA